jgi:hypothetical protein
MRDMGIRGRFAYGTPVGMADDAPMDFGGLARIKKDWMPDKDNLLTLGVCSRNLGALTIGGSAAATSRGVLTIEQIKRDWDGARALGLPITMHTSGPSPIMELERAGLLGSDVQLVHPLLTSADERAILKSRGVSYSTSPSSRRAGQRNSASSSSASSGGRREGQPVDRPHRVHQLRSVQLDAHPVRVALAPHRRESAAHLEAAAAARDARRGRRSRHRRPHRFDCARQTRDLVLVRTTDINMAPAGDPYEAIVSLGLPTNVDTVIVDGRILRRAGKFTTFDQAKIVTEAREAAIGLRDRAKSPT